jgi:A/G-specific adenine glycosylase
MPRPKRTHPDPAESLLRWYDAHGRELPWRKKGGVKPNAYHVWLSEIMLQQTTVTAVIPYFHKFLAAWPRVQDLAGAKDDAVMAAWAGLGYYARARNLLKCARTVAARPGAAFPDTEDELRGLPGIGAYTAAAIAAIAFGRRAAVVDGNIERVIARLRQIETPLPAAKPDIKAHVAALTPADRPGDFAQAMMDLGATICTPRNPDCGACPWAGSCEGRAAGVAASLPRKLPKKARPLRRGAAFVAISKSREVLLRRRPEKGLLGGMYEPPGSAWAADFAGLEAAPFKAAFQPLGGLVRHTFTHFDLELRVFLADNLEKGGADGVWAPLNQLEAYALPNVMRKVLAHALDLKRPGPLFAGQVEMD